MKTHYVLSVHILDDSHGEWWESVKTDGTTRMFRGQEMLASKEFATPEKAERYAKKRGFRRFKVVRYDPPVQPSRTWRQTVVVARGEEA